VGPVVENGRADSNTKFPANPSSLTTLPRRRSSSCTRVFPAAYTPGRPRLEFCPHDSSLFFPSNSLRSSSCALVPSFRRPLPAYLASLLERATPTLPAPVRVHRTIRRPDEGLGTRVPVRRSRSRLNCATLVYPRYSSRALSQDKDHFTNLSVDAVLRLQVRFIFSFIYPLSPRLEIPSRAYPNHQIVAGSRRIRIDKGSYLPCILADRRLISLTIHDSFLIRRCRRVGRDE